MASYTIPYHCTTQYLSTSPWVSQPLLLYLSDHHTGEWWGAETRQLIFKVSLGCKMHKNKCKPRLFCFSNKGFSLTSTYMFCWVESEGLQSSYRVLKWWNILPIETSHVNSGGLGAKHICLAIYFANTDIYGIWIMDNDIYHIGISTGIGYSG